METFKNYRYNSLYEFIDTVKQTPERKRKLSTTDTPKDNEFRDSQSIDDALNITYNGHDLKLINSGLDNIKTSEQSTIEIEYSVCGGVPDVPEFLTGNPECMINYNAVPKENKYMHLVLDFSEGWKIKPIQFENRVVAICSIINDLEVNGYRVKLSLANLSKFNLGFVGLFITLKEYEQSFGISEIAGTLHASFLRRIKVLWNEGRSWFKPTRRKKCLDKTHGKCALSNDLKQYVDDQLSEPHVLIQSVTQIMIENKLLFNRCDKFMSVKGAKAYAKHIKTAIEAI